MIFNTVNQYCLDGIVELSKTHALEASADIVDDQGLKLWAKGNKVSEELREKLLRRKLAKPLEVTLTVEGALTVADIIADCKLFLDQNPFFARLLNREALSLLASMRSVSLPHPLRLLLTSAKVNQSRYYTHATATLLVSAGIATRLGASQADAQRLLLASLLLDIGEMYINPDLLKLAHRLEPNEWRHVASHPRIGQLLIEELTTLPPSIGLYVALHHERLDGSGYPRQTDRSTPHGLGAWLAVADSTAAILARGDAGAPLRTALALRIVSEEFDQQAAGTVIQALRKGNDTFGAVADPSGLSAARATLERIQSTLEAATAILTGVKDPFVRKSVSSAIPLLGNLGKSLRATGAAELATFGAEALDAELLAEINVIVREVEWRMRNLARNLHIRAETHGDAACLEALEPLIEALNGREERAKTMTA